VPPACVVVRPPARGSVTRPWRGVATEHQWRSVEASGKTNGARAHRDALASMRRCPFASGGAPLWHGFATREEEAEVSYVLKPREGRKERVEVAVTGSKEKATTLHPNPSMAVALHHREAINRPLGSVARALGRGKHHGAKGPSAVGSS
jgi:hypothetical protein